jgi:hypothetical protein
MKRGSQFEEEVRALLGEEYDSLESWRFNDGDLDSAPRRLSLAS